MGKDDSAMVRFANKKAMRCRMAFFCSPFLVRIRAALARERADYRR